MKVTTEMRSALQIEIEKEYCDVGGSSHLENPGITHAQVKYT